MGEYALSIKEGTHADHQYVGDEWHKIELDLVNAKMVPLIRCKNCAKWGTERRFTGKCTGPGTPDPEGFCSWGESK